MITIINYGLGNVQAFANLYKRLNDCIEAIFGYYGTTIQEYMDFCSRRAPKATTVKRNH